MRPPQPSAQPSSQEVSEERRPPPGGSGRTRKPYRAPRLTEYGRLTELTRFGGSQVVDSGGGLGNMT